MKKFLSLVLALVMTMSLVTISAGAKDFTDGDKVNYAEAIDVMSAVKVIDGYTDGSFKPQTQLNRGQAAKILCNMILGPTTASALKADAAPFKDVAADNTFAAYIAFCAKEGIIDGYTDGTFKPAAPLTGYAFMKFLLGALGYDKDIEGYNGANWSINVAKRALNIGLDDGLTDDFDGTKIVTREEACLFAFNALTADMVHYGNKTTVSIGGAEVVVGAGEATKNTNTTADDYRKTVANRDTVEQFCEKYFPKLELRDNVSSDAFGRPANVWYVKNDKIGTYAKTADLTYYKNVKAKDIYKDLDLSDPYTYTVLVDGAVNGTLALNKTTTNKVKDSGSGLVGNGSTVEVFEDAHKIVVSNEYLLQVSGEYNEKKETLSLTTVPGISLPSPMPASVFTLKSDDFAGLDEFKDDDYVIVTLANDGTNYVIKSIKAADVVPGAVVTEYVDDDTVTAGGTEYSYSAAALTAITTFAYTLKDEYNLYLDSQGNVLFADGVEDEGSYAYISEFGHSGSLSANGTYVAYAYFLDGTEKEITLNKVNGNKPTAVDAGHTYITAGTNQYTGWYRFSEKSTGKYDLSNTGFTQTTTVSTTGLAVTNYDTMHTTIGGTAGKQGNKDTKFVVVKANDDVAVYTGIKNVPDITTGTAGVVVGAVYDGSYAKFVFVDVGTAGIVSGGSNSGDLVYIMKLDKTYGHDVDDDTYYRYNAIVNGEEKKVLVDSNETISVGMLYTDIEYTSKGYVCGETAVATGALGSMTLNTPTIDTKDFKYVNDLTATATGATLKKNTLTVETNSFYLADDAKIFVNKRNDTDLDIFTAGQFVVNYNSDLTGKTVQIFGVLNADAEYTALYVVYR